MAVHLTFRIVEKQPSSAYKTGAVYQSGNTAITMIKQITNWLLVCVCVCVWGGGGWVCVGDVCVYEIQVCHC